MAAVFRILLTLALFAGPAFAAPSAAPEPPALPQSALPVIDRARPADLPALMAIERASFDPAERWSRSAWAQSVVDPEQTVLVIRGAGGKAAASIIYDRSTDADNGRLYIASLGVHPDHRKHGYGRALMRAALDEARRDPSVNGASLHVRADNEAAIALYRKLGFRTLERVADYYGERGANAFYMVWDKAPARPQR